MGALLPLAWLAPALHIVLHRPNAEMMMGVADYAKDIVIRMLLVGRHHARAAFAK